MRRFGFTIVELLVVLAIIALIMGLLIPALGAARLQTRAVVCSSNIKQILNLLAIYEQQNGTFPYGFVNATSLTVSCPGDPAYGDRQGKWWFQYISYITNTEIPNSSVFWCPSRCIEDPTSKHNILCGNYGVNRAICKDAQGSPDSNYVGTPLGLSRIPHPQDTLLVIDSGYSLISWQATNANIPPCEGTLRAGSFYVPGISANEKRLLASPANKSSTAKKRKIDYSINKLNRNDAVNGRHRQKTVNAGYVDGHTKRLKAEELSVLEENCTYTNIQTWIPK